MRKGGGGIEEIKREERKRTIIDDLVRNTSINFSQR